VGEKKKAIFKVKNEYREGKKRKSSRFRQVDEGGCTHVGSSSDDTEDTSDDEGDGYQKGCASSGAEVKGDGDYCPSKD